MYADLFQPAGPRLTRCERLATSELITEIAAPPPELELDIEVLIQNPDEAELVIERDLVELIDLIENVEQEENLIARNRAHPPLRIVRGIGELPPFRAKAPRRARAFDFASMIGFLVFVL